jgi:two-component system, LytTR family, response regulator
MLPNLKTLIVDDELHCRLALKSLLDGHFPQVSLVGMAAHCAEARDLIAATKPDIVLLDIAMPGENGFDLLYSLPNRCFQVVFVTAHEQFAVRAFRASAVDYLLKPVSVDDLREALTKAQQLMPFAFPMIAQDDALQQLHQSLQTKRLDRISLQNNQGVDLVDIDDIHYLEADTNYTRFHLQGGRKIVACHTLKDYEEILEPEGFFRVHRSFLINMQHLRTYSQTPNPEAVLKDGTRVEVSRRRAPLFHEAVRKWKLL